MLRVTLVLASVAVIFMGINSAWSNTEKRDDAQVLAQTIDENPAIAATTKEVAVTSDFFIDPKVMALAQADNAFGLEVYRQVSKGAQNLVFSPYSLFTALAMTSTGTAKATAQEMNQALHLSGSTQETKLACQALMTRLRSLQQRGCQLYLANRLWAQSDWDLRPEFGQGLMTFFDSGIQSVDFVKEAESARKTINDWVKEKTSQKITELLAQGSLSADTKLVLTNAMYFLSPWLTPFEARNNQSATFTLLEGATKEVPFMCQTGEFRYTESKTMQLVELPYSQPALAMVIVLPKQSDGLPDLEQKLTAAALKTWLEGIKTRKVELIFPKFKLENEYGLSETLKSMGIKHAFEPNADFSGITSKPGLFIGQVVHKAVVNVDETGTEAAAASAVVMLGRGVEGTAEPSVKFKADHPFVFFIQERKTGCILFMGRVANP